MSKTRQPQTESSYCFSQKDRNQCIHAGELDDDEPAVCARVSVLFFITGVPVLAVSLLEIINNEGQSITFHIFK